MVAWSKPLDSQTGREYLDYLLKKNLPEWLRNIPAHMRAPLERDFVAQATKYNYKIYEGENTLFKREGSIDSPNRIVMLKDMMYEAVWKCHVDKNTGKHRSKAATSKEVLSIYACPGVIRVVDEWWPCCKWCHKKTVDTTAAADEDLVRRSVELSTNSPGIAAARVNREEFGPVVAAWVTADTPSSSRSATPKKSDTEATMGKKVGGEGKSCKECGKATGNVLCKTILLSSSGSTCSTIPALQLPQAPAPLNQGRPLTPDSDDSYDYVGSVFAPAPVVTQPAVIDTPLPLDPYMPLAERAIRATEAWVQSTSQRVTEMRVEDTMDIPPRALVSLPPVAGLRRFWMNEMKMDVASTEGSIYFIFIFDDETRVLYGRAMIDNGIGAYADVIVSHGQHFSLGHSRGQCELVLPPKFDDAMMENTTVIVKVLYDGTRPFFCRAMAANLTWHVCDLIILGLRRNVDFNSPPGIQCPKNWPRYMTPIIHEYNTHDASRFGVDAFSTVFMLGADVMLPIAVDEAVVGEPGVEGLDDLQFAFDAAVGQEHQAQDVLMADPFVGYQEDLNEAITTEDNDFANLGVELSDEDGDSRKSPSLD